MIRQASTPCPHCGSFYVRATDPVAPPNCNICGAVRATDPAAPSGSEYLRAKAANPRPSRGTGWDKTAHKVIYR